MEGDLSDSYEKVHKKLRSYRKRVSISIFLLYAGIIAFVTNSILLPFAIAIKSSLLAYAAIGFVGLGLMIVSVFVVSTAERPSTEERLFMRTYRALSCLVNYLGDASKTKERKVCKIRLRYLVSHIDKLWSIESAIERETLAPVAALKKNLQNKILYSVEEGSVEHMRQSYNILARLARFFLQDHPSLSEVEEMNKVAKDLPERPTGGENPILGLLQWVISPERFRILIAILSGPAFYVAARLGGVSSDVAFGAATVVAIGLLTPFLTIYVTQGRAGRKLSEKEGDTKQSILSTAGDVAGQDDQGVDEKQNDP